MTAAAPSLERRVAFSPSWPKRFVFLALAVYTLYACSTLDITWARLAAGFGHGAEFIARMLPPNFARWELLLKGLLESVQIAIIASFVGIVLSLPLGLLASRNMMPLWVTAPTRIFIALCRSFHPVIVAILFVKAVGFGAFAGILALIVGSIGFIAKLFAEAIEEISLRQVEAVRATGAPFLNVITFGVLPQVLSRFVGFALYQLDSNLRNSTMVGIVGAGGIGGTLFAAFKRFDYDFVAAILLAIIALIMLGEIFSTRLRRTFQ
jgi:phosphonate transport system permease protein